LAGKAEHLSHRKQRSEFPCQTESAEEAEEQVQQVSVTIKAKHALALQHPTIAAADVSTTELENQIFIMEGS